jgi:GNAT superfamily N-acetyltransferase
VLVARIDRVSPEDWPRLRDVRFRALADEPDAYGSSLEREGAYLEEDWRRLAEAGPWWLAVDGGADVGIVAGGRHEVPEERWVYSMWIEPSQRGNGVAEQLLGEVVTWAIAEGAPRLGLDVTDRVPRARRFYERFGFVVRGRARPLPRDRSIELTEMVLELRAITGVPEERR